MRRRGIEYQHRAGAIELFPLVVTGASLFVDAVEVQLGLELVEGLLQHLLRLRAVGVPDLRTDEVFVETEAEIVSYDVLRHFVELHRDRQRGEGRRAIDDALLQGAVKLVEGDDGR